ncbi:protein of unknown function [Oceanobacillus limi]|uniref:DUF4269 domain-containing protein n=1 Tax=Oceanobacillus limi TaxID=930131 RepID=A0A1I0FEE0_9BACI|nr:DUF4269 domain-containing protein [Oceanobacillus limi]SET56482.1 protein of unknown function [Oceanobacillus limi]
MTTFETIDYLKFGSEKQKVAFHTINELGVMEDLLDFDPILCGTIPLGIDVDGSDLDIIMKVTDYKLFETKVKQLYGMEEEFRVKQTSIRGVPVMKANFLYHTFEFELFGHPQDVKKQNAYLHMVIENAILKKHPEIKKEIIKLKELGYKTEPAFCKVLGLTGDPFETLIAYGKHKEIIN